jgi:DNA-damage-inducible protein J
MATKSANLYVRIEPDVKERAESTFEVKLPSAMSIDMSILSEKVLNVELEKGYADMKAGRTKPASKVFADICKDYNL